MAQAANSRGHLTRRRVVVGTGALAAAALLPHRVAFAAPEISPVTARLSSYMSQARERALPPAVIERARLHILDTFAAMVSGSELPPGRVVLAFARANRGDQSVTIVGGDTLCGPIEAALANAMLAHADETDDSHAPSLSHPGCVVVPAALAVGERFGISGAHFLRAVVLGYDIGPRVTMTLGATFRSDRRLSSHGYAGAFGASAAAGCAASLGVDQMRWLIDYAAEQAAGLNATLRDASHIGKGFVFAGGPARSGVTSALLVHAGAQGVDDILAGPGNFLRVHAPQADPAGLIDQLGERFEINRTNIKKWSVGSPIQAPLDGLETLLQRHRFDAEAVQELIVRLPTNELATVDNRDLPDICLQHMIAIMLVDGTASFRAAHDEPRMRDAAVLRQRAKVRLLPDEELEKRRPNREAIVEVVLGDGNKLSEHVLAVRGTAENPMTPAEVVAKARDLMVPILGEARTSRLIETTLALDGLADIRALRPLLQRT
jgi:2-methylcitrate dehydratase PrpD